MGLFTKENKLQTGKNLKSDILEKILGEKFGYMIQSEDFEKYGTLDNLRSLFIPEKKLLLLNQKLEKDQKTFILAKEIGFNVLELKNRPNTYSWLDFGSFEEILNNFMHLILPELC